MKILFYAVVALSVLNPALEAASQPKRLLASSIHYSNGSFDTTRYYYSGNRGGWHQDAGGDILPKQMVQRDGSIQLMYDSAFVWNGFSASSLDHTARYSNTFDAANRVLMTSVRKYGSQPQNQGEVYSYNSAGYHTLIGFIDSVATWPAMTPYFYKRSTYNSGNLPASDTFLTTSLVPTGGFLYRYNGSGQKEEALQFVYMPGYTVVDSARFAWYANGLLHTEQHTLFDSSKAVAGIRDTFGYAGYNPQYTYRRNDQYFNGSNWKTIWLSRNTLNSANGKHDTLYNYYATSSGAIPSTPSQILIAAYNADSTLSEVAYYSNGTLFPDLVYRYYYSLQTPAAVPSANTVKAGIQVYPVPASASETVSIKVNGIHGTAAITIFNADGKVTLNGTIQPGKTLHIQNFPAGHYVIRCGELSGRIVVR